MRRHRRIEAGPSFEFPQCLGRTVGRNVQHRRIAFLDLRSQRRSLGEPDGSVERGACAASQLNRVDRYRVESCRAEISLDGCLVVVTKGDAFVKSGVIAGEQIGDCTSRCSCRDVFTDLVPDREQVAR